MANWVASLPDTLRFSWLVAGCVFGLLTSRLVSWPFDCVIIGELVL